MASRFADLDVLPDLGAVAGRDDRARAAVAGSSGSPTFIDSALRDERLVKRSTNGRSTRMRDPQTQIWPVFPNAPRALQKTAVSRSASANTRFGFLPPSSSEIALDLRRGRLGGPGEPVSMPPVSDIMSTPGRRRAPRRRRRRDRRRR